MFEVLDKLMVSFGQDTLDSLYYSVSAPAIRKRHLTTNFLVAVAYVLAHAVLLFVHVITLFVAVNSADQALLTLLISNNFAEMKSSVFKRFDPKLLFQLTCSDMVERFKLLLFLGLITLLNFGQHAKEEGGTAVFFDMGKVCGLIFSGEIVADCIKHAFITKFNEIDAGCYAKSAEELAREVTLHRLQSHRRLDRTHVICKKIGFAQLPLAAVAVRFSTIAWSFLPASSWQAALSFGLLLFAVLLLSKIASGLCLTRWAAGIEEREMGKREARAREREREREREALVGSRGGGGSAI
ncbi:tapt1 protein [Nannochloropsis gaditana]|uniref:Tapt1 protein n=1 Tax=Nannochloropsis gaditana TaxID=72520 RepID=W7TY90_9STRA|nr:tapt1 protein [Nannochloropsis gaditana]